MELKKTLLAIISYVCFVTSSAHSQSFSKKFSYVTIPVELQVLGGPINYAADYSGYPAYNTVMSQQGNNGYELIRIDRWSYQERGINHAGITLVFKKEISEWEKYIVDRADSVANAIAKKEISRAEADILNWVNGNKASYTKEFTDKVTAMFEGMLKEYYEKIKQDIIDTLNKKNK